MFLTGKWARLVASGYTLALCVEDAGGAGGGGAGGEGGPKYITEDQVNKAITARLTDAFSKFKKENETSLKTALGSVATDVDKLLTEKLAGFKPQGVEGGGSGDGKGGGAEPKIEDHPTFRGLMKTVEDLKKTNLETSNRAKAERDKARDKDLRGRIADALTSHGIKDAARQKLAVGHLVDSAKRARFADDESDELVFKDDDGSDVDLATGIGRWAKSDEAKIFQAPTGALGSGDRGGGRTPGNAGKGLQRGEFGRALVEAFGGSSMDIALRPPAPTK